MGPPPNLCTESPLADAILQPTIPLHPLHPLGAQFIPQSLVVLPIRLNVEDYLQLDILLHHGKHVVEVVPHLAPAHDVFGIQADSTKEGLREFDAILNLGGVVPADVVHHRDVPEGVGAVQGAHDRAVEE